MSEKVVTKTQNIIQMIIVSLGKDITPMPNGGTQYIDRMYIFILWVPIPPLCWCHVLHKRHYVDLTCVYCY